MPPVIHVPKYIGWISGGCMGGVVAFQAWMLGYLGEPKSALKAPTKKTGKLRVPVWIVADFHCPWSFLNKQSLDIAMRQFPELELEPRWAPHLIYSNIPTRGGPTRRQYVVTHGQAQEVGEEAWAQFCDPRAPHNKRAMQLGIQFQYSETQRMHSTVNAHRLMMLTLRKKGPLVQHQLAQLIYEGFWIHSDDIGDVQVLAGYAERVGFRDPAMVVSYLLSDIDRDLTIRMHFNVRDAFRLGGVPVTKFEGEDGMFQGIQKPDLYVLLLQNYREYAQRQNYVRAKQTSSDIMQGMRAGIADPVTAKREYERMLETMDRNTRGQPAAA